MRKPCKESSSRKFKKLRPPTFDEESKIGQEDEAWFLGIKKYFKIRKFYGNEKAMISIFNLNGKASIWWEHLHKVKGLKERKIEWKKFEM